MAKSIGRVHHVSRVDNHSLDGKSLIITKTLMNKMEQFDAILVLIAKNIFHNGVPRNAVLLI